MLSWEVIYQISEISLEVNAKEKTEWKSLESRVLCSAFVKGHLHAGHVQSDESNQQLSCLFQWRFTALTIRLQWHQLNPPNRHVKSAFAPAVIALSCATMHISTNCILCFPSEEMTTGSSPALLTPDDGSSLTLSQTSCGLLSWPAVISFFFSLQMSSHLCV